MNINCNGTLIDLSTPKVMGILNITPDSFYDGGKYKDESSILRQVETMLSDGATFIDIGAYSSRPGAAEVTEPEELQRIVPVVELLQREFPNALLSIDTFRSSVAKACVAAGASMINDISGGMLDPKMIETVAGLHVPYVMMHMKGTPQNMQDDPTYEDVTKEVLFYFSEQIAEARKHNMKDIIVDPGFGFGKTIEHNYELLKKLSLFSTFELPVLIGISRKSMIYRFLDISSEDALNGTTALHTAALLNGAHILRVHDVKEAIECVKLTQQLR